tara:strand:+ start:160 stop:549 length:390 start_codon:yes stop_codon:yes gene_type:complete
MGNRFAAGKRAISECDRCGFRFKLKNLKGLVIKTKNVNILVCPQCWEPDHPQLLLGMYPVDDPQALRNPRPDRSYITSGLLVTNYLGEGSRAIYWGWNPVGGSRLFTAELTPNPLVAVGSIGTVTVSTT